MPETTFLLAGEVMDRAASLMNDTAKTVYTYTAVLPYLKMALDALDMEFQLNNIPVTNKTGLLLPVAIGQVSIPIPGDCVEIQGLYERLFGSSDPFIQMTKKEFLPHYLEQPTDSLLYWNYEEQLIKFPPGGAQTKRQVKIDYIRTLFMNVNDQNTPINVINTRNALAFLTASLCARYIGEDTERADSLAAQAGDAIDTVIGIGTKGRQSIATRRRPFRANYRSRGIW
jgi:hypothetical protein